MQVVLGTLLAALVPVVGFNAVLTSEHFASFLVSSFSMPYFSRTPLILMFSLLFLNLSFKPTKDQYSRCLVFWMRDYICCRFS